MTDTDSDEGAVSSQGLHKRFRKNNCEYFISTLMTSERVNATPKRFKKVKKMVQKLFDDQLTPDEFLHKLENELKCGSFSCHYNMLDKFVPLIRNRLMESVDWEGCILITNKGKIIVTEEWKMDRTRKKLQKEIFKLIDTVNETFGYPEEIVTIQTVSVEWEDKIFHRSQTEDAYKSQISLLMGKIEGIKKY